MYRRYLLIVGIVFFAVHLGPIPTNSKVFDLNAGQMHFLQISINLDKVKQSSTIHSLNRAYLSAKP
jgi:hypothetical protein